MLAPAWVAESFAGSRQLVYSTGCVYPNVLNRPVRRRNPLEPVGEYANTCIGRERVFEWFAGQVRKLHLPAEYAVDLRYVLVDIAEGSHRQTGGRYDGLRERDMAGRRQRPPSSAAPASIPFHCPYHRPEKLSVREVAHRFEELLGRKPVIVGGPTAH